MKRASLDDIFSSHEMYRIYNLKFRNISFATNALIIAIIGR